MRRPQLRLIPDSRRRLLAAAALSVGVAVITGLVLGIGVAASPAPSHAAAASTGVTTVQRRNLVATDTESGTLSYSEPQTVYNRLSGTITWLPSAGQVIRPGQALFKVDGEPVLLMDGTTPAYRDLSAADGAGADILELNRNLARLGFNASAITVDDVWQPATTYGVDLLQESLGAPATGSLTLGQVVFLPGDQLVSAVDATLGSTGGASPTGGTGASLSLPAPAPQFVSLTSPPSSTSAPTTAPATTAPATTAPATTAPAAAPPRKRSATHNRPATATPRGTRLHPGKPGAPSPHHPATPTGAASGQTLAALSALLKAESAQLRADAAALRARGGAPSKPPAGSGNSPSSAARSPSGAAGGGGASPILQTTSSKLAVTVDLPATSQSEARVGEHVTVELPNTRTVGGRITAVSAVAQTPSNSGNGNGGNGNGNGNGGPGGSSSTIPVTIALRGLHGATGLDEAAVSVNFVSQQARNVLSVPVTALLATAGGGYDVQEAAAPHTLLPVRTGLFAAGYVQIFGPGITPGLRVTDSQG